MCNFRYSVCIENLFYLYFDFIRPASLSLVSYTGISERESEQLMTELNEISKKSSESGMVIMLEISHHVQVCNSSLLLTLSII